MQLHVIGAIGALAFGIWHVVTRRTRVHKTDLSRRNALKAVALFGAGTAVYGALEGALHITRAPGAERRFTGSHEKGSGDPAAMPVTQWLDDSVPTIDVATWSLEVDDGRLTTRFTYEELSGFQDGIETVIDCTGGWYAEQAWTGLWLSRLLPDGIEGRSILVRSVTGYSRRFAPASANGLLLATRVAGEGLSAGHGYPVRLVAPGRRGFWWIKWVAAIEPSPLPPWAQLPFPIS